MKIIEQFWRKHWEIILIAGILLMAGVFHGVNMLHYPYFENDEGTYMAQAWSFLQKGKLTPYTYWYDHAPVGWIFTSLWIYLTGGLFTFGFSLNSGRVFMLFIHLISTLLLYKCTKKITKSGLAAFIACLFFIISPLGIYFQRRLLLDNIMTFWILISLYLVLYARQRLWMYIMSAIFFGIATLSKENGIFFMPVFIGLVAFESHKNNRIFAVIKWITITSMIISLYFSYALIKKELFPTGSIFSPAYEHASLIGSLQSQAGRGTGLPFWNTKSDFFNNLYYWFMRDRFFMALGIFSFFVQGIFMFFKKSSRIIFFLTFSMLAFFLSGKLVINFYIIPILPFVGMCIGETIAQPLKETKKYWGNLIYALFILIIITGIGYHYYNDTNLHDVFYRNETNKQIEAVDWVKKNIPSKSFIAIDYYSNLDLNESRYNGDPKFINAHSYWKVEDDPDIREKILKDDYKKVDYILLTAQVYSDIKTFSGNSTLLGKVLSNSRETVNFATNDPAGLSLSTYYTNHPNGDWVMVYKQNNDKENLNFAWNLYKKRFIDYNGQTVDPETFNTSSEKQGYSLMHALISEDKKTFQQVFEFTLDNMKLKDKNLFASLYGRKTDGGEGIINSGTTTKADENIALALILAGKKWNDDNYITIAKKIIKDIWKYDSATIKGKRYIVAGDWTSQENNKSFALDISDLMPYAYKQFAKIDKDNNWEEIGITSYGTLEACTNLTLDSQKSAGLPPDWCVINKNGTFAYGDKITASSSDYSGNAWGAIWNLILDFELSRDVRAFNYLKKMQPFWEGQWKKEKAIYSRYSHGGNIYYKAESLSHYAIQMAYFKTINNKIAKEIYENKVLRQFNTQEDMSYWGKKPEYNDQNWVPLGYSVYANLLSDYIR